MRYLLFLSFFLHASLFLGYTNTTNCDSLKVEFEKNKKDYDLYEEYYACLKKNGDTSSIDYALVNKSLAKICFEKEKWDKGLNYSFVSKEIFDSYNKKQSLDFTAKSELLKLYNNIEYAYSKAKEKNINVSYEFKKEKFADDYLNLFLNKNLKNQFSSNQVKDRFFKALFFYVKCYKSNNKLITKKSIEKVVKKIYNRKEYYLKAEHHNIYQQIGYILRTNDYKDWSLVESMYLNYYQNLEKEHVSIDSLNDGRNVVGIMYMYKYKDDNTRDTAFVEYFDDILSSTENPDVKIKTLKTCGKAFYFQEYWERASFYWDLASNEIKDQKGIYIPEYVEIIAYLKKAYMKYGNKKAEHCNKILLKINSQIKNPLDYKLTCITSSSNGDLVVAGADNGNIYLWDRSDPNSKTGDNLIFEEHQSGDPIKDVFIKKDGSRIISIGNYDIKLWNSHGDSFGSISLTDSSKEISSSSFEDILFSKKNNCFKIGNTHYSYDSDTIEVSSSNICGTRYELIDDYYTCKINNEKKIELKEQSKEPFIISNSNAIIDACISDGDDNTYLFGIDVNGQINVWQYEDISNVPKIDSLDLRRKPDLYFISISDDTNNLSKDCYEKVTREIYKSDIFNIDNTIHKTFSGKSLIRKDLIHYHDSISQIVHKNDLVIYYISGFEDESKIVFPDSENLEISKFYLITEKLASTEKMFFIDSDNSYPFFLRNAMDEQLSANGNFKENKIIISESNGQYLTESFLGADASLLDLFRTDHKVRTECLHQLYNYSDTISLDYRLKSYFQKDNFELDLNNNDLKLNPDKISFQKTLVILVGVSDYVQKDKLSDLQNNPINDIDTIETTLKREFKIEKEHIIKIVNPTKSQLVSKLNEELNKREYESGSQLLFYFAGHGAYVNNISYLLFKDSFINEYQVERGLTFEELRKMINRPFDKGLKKSLIILDACHQGSVDGYFTELKHIPDYPPAYYRGREVKNLINRTASIAITSTSEYQLAPNGKRNGNSPFCLSFLDALDKNRGTFTNNELFYYVKRDSKLITRNHISLGKSDNPQEKPLFFFFKK